MNITRNFMLIGTVFLIIGLFIGMYMGGSGDHSLSPAHAHINLVGFVLSMVFGLVYRVFPDMAAGRLPQVHLVAHGLGAIGLNVMLFLLFAGQISHDAMAPMAPISELLVTIGVLIFGWQILRHAR